MSVVTGVVLCMSSCEDSIDTPDGLLDEVPLLTEINRWLTKNHYGTLYELSRLAGGRKHPQMFFAAGGFNGLGMDADFIAMVMALPWLEPENLVLVMQPENGPTMVYRPEKPQ